jgi:hypothetical protein
MVANDERRNGGTEIALDGGGVFARRMSDVEPLAEVQSPSLLAPAARRQVAHHIGRLWRSQVQLADALAIVANRHDRESGVRDTCKQLEEWARRDLAGLQTFVTRYGRRRSEDAEQVFGALFHGQRAGGLGLLRDLHDLALLVEELRLGWATLRELAPELHDDALERLAERASNDTDRQLAWLETRLKATAPQALAVPRVPAPLWQALFAKTPTPAAVSELGWAPLVGGLAVGAIGTAGLVAGVPWLAASLGATIYTQVVSPADPSSRCSAKVCASCA